MCLITEVASIKELLLLLVASSVIYNTFQKMDLLTQNLRSLKEKFDSEKVSQNDTMRVLKKTVERLKDELRESEAATKRALKELRLQQMDKTGLVDYAYGGRVTPTQGTESYLSEGVNFFGVSVCGQNYLEGRIVETSVMPGDCWPIKGQQGSAIIELIEDVNVSQISLEHAPKELLPNGASSAPKEFSLLGLSDNENENQTPHLFGRFAYNLASSEVQTFPVQIPSSKSFKKVEVQIHSNHGHSEFTCVYRVRIHGNTRK
ncbi:sperm-associated antigen 4 protein-like [Macrosteles quadrilineatus]|uniref:sperm-associated antigen 4 protein-like n=1 Tax=Macrosteles quadrilineatus TaxID=74068 RepID=UPI0023E15017|nr:sperm-associated antigen 4 protein-like [Macrosteles quadrilineatus]